jgi:peptidyl-prolyl cis-trans isomerase A (cyclophilin A)
MQAIRRLILSATLATAAAALCGAALAQGAGATAMPAPKAAAPVVVTLETTAGPIVLELDAQAAPRTVANFVQYVKDGFYAGTIFHRVIDGFMIQGGGFNGNMAQKPTRPPIAIESNNGLKNVRGSIAMARTSDPNSATAQFFINVVDNPALDYPGRDNAGYTVFGRVVEGMDNVDKIRTTPTTVRNGMPNVPVTPVVIDKARLGK